MILSKISIVLLVLFVFHQNELVKCKEYDEATGLESEFEQSDNNVDRLRDVVEAANILSDFFNKEETNVVNSNLENEKRNSHEIDNEQKKTKLQPSLRSISNLNDFKHSPSLRFRDAYLPRNLHTARKLVDEETETPGLPDDGDVWPSRGRYGYLNEWVVHLEGGETFAAAVMDQLGFKITSKLHGLTDMYRVSRENHPRLHKRAAVELTQKLNNHNEVIWAEQQRSRIRHKKGMTGFSSKENSQNILNRIISNHTSVRTKAELSGESRQKEHIRLNTETLAYFDRNPSQNYQANDLRSHLMSSVKDLHVDAVFLQDIFNDELVDHQWYLEDSRTTKSLPKIDMSVMRAWAQGATGYGVNVTILDDGIDYTHEDLRDNYSPALSYDVNDDDDDPMPRHDLLNGNSHGTKCAGEVAMVANNFKCGVGVAFEANIGGVRMLDGHVSDRVEAEALSHARNFVDIVSCSWGPPDSGSALDGPGRLAQMAFERGVAEGRNGKGTIFVWAAGNGGLAEDNCNCDGYASSIYTVSINSASESNKFPYYGERCSSTLASTYSSGAYYDQKIVTTDLNNQCTVSFAGTSAAAPLGAGVVALAIHANPNLTWRDVQHLIVYSSGYDILKNNEGWYKNGAGLWVNLRFGFGLLNAEKMVRLARKWKNVPNKVICSFNSTNQYSTPWSKISQKPAVLKFTVEECRDKNLRGVSLEHVQVVVSSKHSKRGAVQIDLTSPSGTTTTLLTQRAEDSSTDGFEEWPFMSVHTWGETPIGTWTLTFSDASVPGYGWVESAYLVLHASSATPNLAKRS